MLSLNATQQSIIDAANKGEVSWLFEVDANGNGSIDYYWSTKVKTWNAHNYIFKVIDFDPIRMQRAGSEMGIQRPTEFSFTISNKDNALSAASFSGGNVTVRQVVRAGANEAEIRAWSFDFVQQPEDVEQTLVFTCRDWLQSYLDGNYPNTPLVNALFPHTNVEENNLCVPVILGEPTIPVMPVVRQKVVNGTMEESGHWTAVGSPTTCERSSAQAHNGTYSWKLRTDAPGEGMKGDTFSTKNGQTFPVVIWFYPVNQYSSWLVKVRRGDNSGWMKSSYDGREWKDIYATSNMLNKWNRFEIFFTEGAATEGSGAYIEITAATYTDETVYFDDISITGRYYIVGPKDSISYTYNWVTNEDGTQRWKNLTSEENDFTGTDGNDYHAVKLLISDVDGDGTADNNLVYRKGKNYVPLTMNYKRGDTGTKTNPGDVLDYILQDFGVPSSRIDATTLAAVKSTYTSWGLTFHTGFWFHEAREEILARLLTMCHTELIVRDKLYFKVHSKASQKTLTHADIMARGENEPTSFSYANINYPETSDTAYVAYGHSDHSLASLVKAVVTAKGTSTQIVDITIRADYVRDSQDAQRIGTLGIQRRFLKMATVDFNTKATCLALEPDDVSTFNDNRYGGNYSVLIDAVEYYKDLGMRIEATRFREALDDWTDLTPPAIDLAQDDDSGAVYQVMMVGPDGLGDTGTILANVIKGNFRVGYTGNYILFQPDRPLMSFVEGGVVRVKVGDLSTEDYGIELLDHAGNSIFKLDGSGTNTLVGFTVSATEFSSDSGNIKLNSATPFISLGAATAYLTGNGIWMGKVGSYYKEHHGDPEGQHWYWDPETGKLYVKGDIEATSFIAAGTKADTFSVNSDQDDVDVKLILDRTTGGAASFKWDGSLVELDKSFKPSELGINDISNTAPETTFAGQVWLDTS